MNKSPIEIAIGQTNILIEDEVCKAVGRVGIHINKEELLKALKAYEFVEELTNYIFEYPDDDYMTMECLCRKLVKHDLIDKEDGYYLVDKGIKIAEQTEREGEWMTYTEKELDQFLHGISLSLLSKKSAQHWRYDEETAKEIEWLEALERKVRADKADRKTEPMKTTDYCDICKRDMCEDCIADATNPYCVPSHYEINYESKDELTISKMEQVEEPERNMAEDIVESFGFKAESYRQAKAKTEPQAEIKGSKRLLKGSDEPQQKSCATCKHALGNWDGESNNCGRCCGADRRFYEPKDEPQTETKIETQNSNLTFEKRTMRDCYNCKKYETEGECIECHYEPKTEPNSSEKPNNSKERSE